MIIQKSSPNYRRGMQIYLFVGLNRNSRFERNLERENRFFDLCFLQTILSSKFNKKFAQN